MTHTNRTHAMLHQNGFKLLGLMFLGLILTSCGGSGRSSTNTLVNNLSPANNDSAVNLATVVSASFKEDIFAITLTNSSFILETGSGEIVPATVTYNVATKTVSLIPDDSLVLLAPYTATLKSTITDLEGNALTETQWQFITRDGSWQEVSTADSNTSGDSFDPALVVDSSGNALVVFEGTDDTIFSNRYTPENGWESPQAIEPIVIGITRDQQIVMDNDGNALAVWGKFDGIRYNIWSNRYTRNVGWETAQMIEVNNISSSSLPQVAFDNDGNALAVWQQGSRLMFNRYNISNNMWGITEEAIELGATGNVRSPQIAIDNNGNALVVWRDVGSMRSHIWSNHYTPETGWNTTAQQIESNPGSAFSPQIIFDDEGNAMAAWEQLNVDGSVTDIWSNRYTSESGWEMAQLVETNDFGSANRVQIAVDSIGNAIAVWAQDDRLEFEDDVRSDIWSNRYTSIGGWATAQLIETDDRGSAAHPQIVIDSRNNALAVWQQDNGVNDDIWSNRYTSDGDWGSAEPLNSGNVDKASRPQIAIDNSGRALAVWQLDDAVFPTEIKSNNFK